MPETNTPRVPPEAVKAAVSATRSTEPWCELAISAALPAIHAERDRAWREALLAERAIEVAGGICLDTVAMVEIGPSAAQGVIEAAIGAALDSLQVSGAAQLTNREETPNG